MGRPLESPWEVRWTPAASYRHLSLFHGDRRVLRSLPPHNMLPVVEAAGLATSDLRHLLLWAAWLVTAFFKWRQRLDSTTDRETFLRQARTARSILRPPPGETAFDFDRFWEGCRVEDPVVPYAAVAHLPPPPPLEVIDDGFTAGLGCASDLAAFLASR